MGTFVHALDAESGRVIWTSDEASLVFCRMPHPGSASFNGLSAQGHLVVAGDKLIVPGSASSPGVFDRRTGRFLFFGDGRSPGVAAWKRYAFAGGQIFDVDTGWPVQLTGARRPGRSVLPPDVWHTQEGDLDPAGLRVEKTTLRVPETTLPGEPTSVLAADGRLIAVTAEGSIHCFGGERRKARSLLPAKASAALTEEDKRAGEILRLTGARAGHCLVWGPMIRGRTIYTQQQRAYDLLTGKQITWRDAQGRQRQWRFRRSHGCGAGGGGAAPADLP